MQSPTQELLETEPLKYLELIKTMNEFDEVNDTTYYSWYSNHAQSLSYITGTLESEHNENFYGCIWDKKYKISEFNRESGSIIRNILDYPKGYPLFGLSTINPINNHFVSLY